MQTFDRVVFLLCPENIVCLHLPLGHHDKSRHNNILIPQQDRFDALYN